MVYRWLWTNIGGRPWTFIIRDSYHGYPIPWIFGVMIAGDFLGWVFTAWRVLTYLGVCMGGIILGHLFWGSPWRGGQKQ